VEGYSIPFIWVGDIVEGYSIPFIWVGDIVDID